MFRKFGEIYMDSLDKLYFKLNRELDCISTKTSEEEIISNFKRVSHLMDELNLTGEIIFSTNKEKLLNPILVKLATNKDLYCQYAEELTYMSYEKFMNGIALLSDEEVFEYLKENIKYTSYNNIIESMWMDKFIANHINRKICPSIFSGIFNSKKNDEFRVFCDSLLKKKASDYSIRITSNPITLSEYLNRTRATRSVKLVLKRTNEYLKCTGNCNADNLINLNLTTFKLAQLLSSKRNINYELLQVIYHELAHAKIEHEASLQYPFFDRNIYMQQKNKIFLLNDHDYYLKNHDYFENEILAEINGYTDLISDLKEYECKDYWQFKKKSEAKIAKCKISRTTKQYYEIEDRFDELLIKNPDFIKLNRWLRYEYNSDGKRKEIPDLIEAKTNYKLSLDKQIESEKRIGSQNNITLDYKNGYKLINEADNLFYEMIYRRIKEYTLEEFDEYLGNCPMEILSEIISVIDHNQDVLFAKQDMLEENIFSINDFNENENENNINSLLSKNKEYRILISKHIKQKRR